MDTFFNEKYAGLLRELGDGKPMVLSTAADGRVSSRMMSIAVIGGGFWFQTDLGLPKYAQLSSNPRAALCIDNLQIEGVCRELGRPLDCDEFCEVFRRRYKGSYDAYTALPAERLFRLEPERIERWIYQDGKPFIERFDITHGVYSIEEYGTCN